MLHAARYPLMEPADAGKLAYQSEFGPGHLIDDPASAEAWIEKERREALASASSGTLSPSPPYLPLGGKAVRVSLDALPCSAALLGRVFAASAGEWAEPGPGFSPLGSREGLREKFFEIGEAAKAGVFRFSYEEWSAYLAAYEKAGFPPVHHSDVYRRAYRPAYRVISREYAQILPLLSYLEERLTNRSGHNPLETGQPGAVGKAGAPFVLAIDGNAASGKTTLARRIASVFPCALLHMDDFFLPIPLRTEERLREPGGNVHYERFREEVLCGIASGKPFSYGVFDCGVMDIRTRRTVEPEPLYIIEGSYSHHPFFGSPYDLRVFLHLDGETQRKRILRRNGPQKAEVFRTRWVPMENRYFDWYGIEEKSDVTLDASEGRTGESGV